MNKENLQKMADYIKTIPQEKFDMSIYRNDYTIISNECNSVGCIIGHCTILDELENIPISYKGIKRINFTLWAQEFTGIKNLSLEWYWCFISDWSYIDNTPIGASKRIEYLLKKGLPKNFYFPSEEFVKLYNHDE